MGGAFDRQDAQQKLRALGEVYGVSPKDNGGGLRNGCDYDTYVLVGDDSYYASIAIRNPKSDRPPYFAITRMANGRKVIDDQVPMSEWQIAPALFDACVAIARLGNAARTIGLIDRRDQLWTHDAPAKR
jgi:hypothetical protein